METNQNRKQEPLAHLSNGEVIFQVPLKYVQTLFKNHPELRHDFSDLGGKHLGKSASE